MCVHVHVCGKHPEGSAMAVLRNLPMSWSSECLLGWCPDFGSQGWWDKVEHFECHLPRRAPELFFMAPHPAPS